MTGTGTRSARLAALPGVPESRLDDALAARLPVQTPGAPWDTRVEAVLWWHRATPDAAAALPEPLRPRRGLPITVAAFIRYAETPVGPYSEFLAAPQLVRAWTMRVHVPLIAVDSVPSVHGGRAHWSLPKTLADFSWTDLDRHEQPIRGGGLIGAGRPRVRVAGSGWSVAATVQPHGPSRFRLPVASIGSLEQVGPEGERRVARVRVRGWGRPATVSVERTADASFAPWLRPGRHLGFLVTSGRVVVGSTSAP